MWDFVCRLVATAGGFTVATLAIIKFAGAKIIELFFERYKTLEQKDIENYKVALNNKQYVTQKRYDKIFDIYEELTSATYEAIEYLSALIPVDRKITYPLNAEEWNKYVSDNLEDLKKSCAKAKKAIYRYVPFIQESHEKKYMYLIELIEHQISIMDLVQRKKRTDLLKPEDFSCTKEINNKLLELNNEIREYLLSLEVMK